LGREKLIRSTAATSNAPSAARSRSRSSAGRVSVAPAEPRVLEHEILGHQQPALRGQLTQPDGLALDRLVLTLALGGHPRVIAATRPVRRAELLAADTTREFVLDYSSKTHRSGAAYVRRHARGAFTRLISR
jgi:hypothetical protein